MRTHCRSFKSNQLLDGPENGRDHFWAAFSGRPESGPNTRIPPAKGVPGTTYCNPTISAHKYSLDLLKTANYGLIKISTCGNQITQISNQSEEQQDSKQTHRLTL